MNLGEVQEAVFRLERMPLSRTLGIFSSLAMLPCSRKAASSTLLGQLPVRDLVPAPHASLTQLLASPTPSLRRQRICQLSTHHEDEPCQTLDSGMEIVASAEGHTIGDQASMYPRPHWPGLLETEFSSVERSCTALRGS